MKLEMEIQAARVRERLSYIARTGGYPMDRHLTERAINIARSRRYRAAFAAHVARVERALAPAVVVEFRRAA